MTASDRAARERALDPTRSFIVQAPAGAGKTGLLTQRFLRLLALADAPEQIVAITFTRKAAAEMRRRILKALRGEEPPPAADDQHAERTRALASAAREHAQARGWMLESHPARLRIQTIDGFCATLAAQSPLLSRTGAELEVMENASPIYRAAAHRTIGALGDSSEIDAALRILLRHRDNQVQETGKLIAGMLERREQWLPIVLGLRGRDLRERLERDLMHEVLAHLRRLVARWPAENLAAASRLAAAAASRIEGEEQWLIAWRQECRTPRAAIEDLALWRGLAFLFLTKEGSSRERITVQQGFPPSARADKAEMTDLVAEVGRVPLLAEELACIARLPDPRIGDEHWRIAEALIAVLKQAAQALELEFRASGRVDFVAVAAAAREALGAPEQPTDLALALDYRIHHLLVDEYQDTSASQFRLLEQLTSGWSEADGRTLFCVGDPMQSIYRFRQAEVGLFLRTRDRGLGSLKLERLVLGRNFRSQAGLVDWCNEVFAGVLPMEDDIARGAVRHVPSESARSAADPGVVIHTMFDADRDVEAAQVVATVRDLLARNPAASIGILGRQRAHLERIAALMTEQAVPFQAVELEPLVAQPVVRDLMALSRALLHLADRTAWLALLRSPVCGLTLADLEALTREAPGLTIWELMNDGTRPDDCTVDGRRRLGRVRETMTRALERPGWSLRRRVEGAWLELGGPAAARDLRALEDARAFLERLRTLETLRVEVPLPAGEAFEELFEDLYARDDPRASSQIQLMTAHRAKGLEFDAVILPGLGRGRGERDRALLHWMEVPRPDDPPGLLLAPIGRKGADTDPLTGYLQFRLNECADFERARLLYVAVTRARRELHLFGHVGIRKRNGSEEMATPDSVSALMLLWPAVEARYRAAFLERAVREVQPIAAPVANVATIRRMAAEWSLPEPDAAIEPTTVLAVERHRDVRPEFDWASEAARRIGTVVHSELERWSRQDVLPSSTAVEQDRARFARLVRAAGLPRNLVADAVDRVTTALRATLEDERGRWIFDPDHHEVRGELALSGVVAGEIVSVIIDRTFVDAAGVRWLIDFKTSTHQGADRDAFLDNEVERYRAQLARYAQLLARLGPQRVQCALYFPLLGGWREVGVLPQ